MDISKQRRLTAVVLAVVAVPLTFLSIFDPLEGGMALLATFVLNRLIRVISGTPTNRLYLWSFGAAVVTGGIALAIAITQGSDGKDIPGAAVALAYGYSAITLLVTAGAAKYAWDLFRAFRAGARR